MQKYEPKQPSKFTYLKQRYPLPKLAFLINIIIVFEACSILILLWNQLGFFPLAFSSYSSILYWFLCEHSDIQHYLWIGLKPWKEREHCFPLLSSTLHGAWCTFSLKIPEPETNTSLGLLMILNLGGFFFLFWRKSFVECNLLKSSV